jgi:arylsulfatase
MVTSALRWASVALLVVALGTLASPRAGTPSPPALLLLVTVDTLRADRLGAYGSTRGLTPYLDAQAAASTVFTRAYAPASFTVPSLAALMTGRHPEALGLWSNESGLPADVPTLATVLRARGWRTSAVVSNFVARRSSGLAHGFEHYDDRLPDREAHRHWPERVAEATTADALTALDACAGTGAPCFLWVHYQDPHGPYTPPPALRARYLARERAAADGTTELPLLQGNRGFGGIPRYQAVGDEREVAFYRSGYDAEVAYLDGHVGRLLGALDTRGLRERAVVVFAADHGEGLGEHDYWFAHGEHLTEPLVRVPLFIAVPGRAPARRADVAALVDVLPTLRRLLAAGESDETGSGRDLLAPGARRRASVPYLATLGGARVSRWGIVDGEYKYVVGNVDAERAGRLFRLADETTDVAARFPDVRARLARRLDSVRAAMTAPRVGAGAHSPAARARLRALGYGE